MLVQGEAENFTLSLSVYAYSYYAFIERESKIFRPEQLLLWSACVLLNIALAIIVHSMRLPIVMSLQGV